MSLTRREFIKHKAVAAAATTAGITIPIHPAAAQGSPATDGVRWDKGVCRYCGTGCGVLVGVITTRDVLLAPQGSAPVAVAPQSAPERVVPAPLVLLSDPTLAEAVATPLWRGKIKVKGPGQKASIKRCANSGTCAAKIGTCAALAAARVQRLPDDADWRTPWELEQEPQAIVDHEMALFDRSAARAREWGWLD